MKKAILKVYNSTEEVEADIEKLMEKWPQLREIIIADTNCCSGCAETDIGYTYGWDIALAWSELQDYYYLLGKDLNGN